MVGTALAQSDGSREYPLVALSYQTCVKAHAAHCLATYSSDTYTDLPCLCQAASNSVVRSKLRSCLEISCDTLNAQSVIQYLGQVCEQSRSPIRPAMAEEDISSITRETVTATGLTRAHRNMPRSMTSEPAATVTGGSTVAAGNGSATISTSISPSRSSGAGPKATQNGGTVLDQAGTAGANSVSQARSLCVMSLGFVCLVGILWLW